MKNKRWMIALAIIGVLAFTFFWGGDYQKSTTKVAESNIETPVISETTSPLVVEAQPEGTISEQMDAEETKSVGNSSKLETEHPTKLNELTTKDPADDKEKSEEIQKPTSHAEKPDKAVTKTEDNTPKADAPATTPSKPAQEDKKETNTEAKQDKYLTEPVPEGKPKPVEWQDVTINKNEELTITLSVTAATILDNMDIFNEDKLEVLPEDGVIYKAKKVTFYEGESVFDVLLREMKKSKIHMEFSMTPIYNSNYIEGINNLYEFDCGELSGWMYKVNEWFPNYGSSRYLLKDGDVVDWVYTCDLGRDIGGGMAATGEGK